MKPTSNPDTVSQIIEGYIEEIWNLAAKPETITFEDDLDSEKGVSLMRNSVISVK
jgi:hypothetical protein